MTDRRPTPPQTNASRPSPTRYAPGTHPNPRPAPPRGAISPAREAAFAILRRVGSSAAHSDDLLHGPAVAKLSALDRDLTTTLVLGVLRWQIALDARIRPFLSRPEAPLPEAIAIALRLGAFQLLHLDRIPAHAALSESVELARANGQPQAAGMVNAILRKLLNAPAPRKPIAETVATMAERLAHPAWLVEGWAEQYGRSAAEAICSFDQKQPGCASLFLDAPSEVPLQPMDAGSRLVAELAAYVGASGQRVWDCCAAPGGKTVVLGRRLPTAELLATDSSALRLKRLADRLARELPGHTLTLEQADASLPDSARGDFDLILCDVPCSGTGTLARNPEIRHRLQPDDLDRQVDRQVSILQNALGHLRPGGHLIYSTCSLEGEECQGVLREALRIAPFAVTQKPVTPLLAELYEAGRLSVPAADSQAWVQDGTLRTLPGANFPGDGFFAAVLQRR